MRGHSGLLSALVERWRLETHTFHLSVGEVTVTLEDVSYILSLPINEEAVTGRSDSSHQFLVENCIAYFGQEPSPQDHVLGKVNIAWVRRCRDTEPCDTQESLERYVRAHIFCVLGTVVFPDKSTTSLNSKFLPLLRDFHRISAYSRVIGADIQDIYGGLLRILVYMAAIYGSRKSGCPRSLMVMCSTQSPLVSFECIEWHLADRVRRQFGIQELPPGPAFDLGHDHCKRLIGAQNHDWRQIYSRWVNRWRFDRYNTLQLDEEIIDFHPLPVYYEWYT
ncbi:serine/threonine-protein phosphatase 7 long form homolog [Arachis hypogaea]|uniref:serine/threonine-protein phosphatase 7 long form homolog n=1 Tax=Arachis hypogaea TaxID=3818 RepID=UPI003B215F80